MNSDDSLSPTQLNVLQQLLTGAGVKQSATAAGVDRTTVHRWLREDLAFGAAYNRARTELRGDVDLRLLTLADRSLDTLTKALDDGDSRIAMNVLKGLGFLPGEVRPIGSGQPDELKQERDLERQRVKNLHELGLLAIGLD